MSFAEQAEATYISFQQWKCGYDATFPPFASLPLLERALWHGVFQSIQTLAIRELVRSGVYDADTLAFAFAHDGMTRFLQAVQDGEDPAQAYARIGTEMGILEAETEMAPSPGP